MFYGEAQVQVQTSSFDCSCFSNPFSGLEKGHTQTSQRLAKSVLGTRRPPQLLARKTRRTNATGLVLRHNATRMGTVFRPQSRLSAWSRVWASIWPTTELPVGLSSRERYASRKQTSVALPIVFLRTRLKRPQS